MHHAGPTDEPRRSVVRGLAVAALLLGALHGEALASPSSEVEVDRGFELAKQAFAEGLAHLDAGRPEAAAAAFTRSLEHRRGLPALFNLALALERIGRVKDAAVALRQFLEESAEQGSREGVARASELLRQLEAALGRVTLEVSGPAGEVWADGRVIGQGPGVFGLVLDPGPHHLGARGLDGADAEARVVLDPGAALEVKLALVAAPPPASLRLAAAASGRPAEISLDGSPVGLGRYEALVAAGKYLVEVRAEGHLPQARALLAAPGDVAELEVALEPEPSSVLTSWWFWAGVLTVAGAAGVAAAVSSGRPEPRYDGGTLGLVLETGR